MGQIKGILERLKRDKDGRVVLQKGNEGLWESIQTRLKRLSPSGG